MLLTLTTLLGAILIAVPLTRRLGFGSVLGYLLAGVLIGPSALGLITDVGQITAIAQLGVVMLLFLIGLELRPQRLWTMRKAVFLLGPAQLCLTAAALAALGHWAGLNWAAATVVGTGFALSSTATVLPMLAERDLLGTQAGRDSFAVLLFQDLAFVPLVALLPVLAETAVPDRLPWMQVVRGAGAIALILIGGRFLLRPSLRMIAGLRTPEIFTALALMIVVATALLCEEAGLSASLGAFLAGVLLSDSQYRHELRANIEPFEGLLLGFFFLSVGMAVDLRLAVANPAALVAGVAALLATKILLSAGPALAMGRSLRNAVRLGIALPQGSEFSFVLFTAAVVAGALPVEVSAFATLVVAASILTTPVLFAASETVLIPRLTRRPDPQFDRIDGADAPVVICGFGRVGQIVGRVLRLHRIPFTALDEDPEQVAVLRELGYQVYFGDPTRLDVLRAAGAARAKLLVIAVPDIEKTLRVADIAKAEFPDLRILARARNRFHVHLLMDREVDGIVRETFHSSLRLTELVLEELGVPHADAERALKLFAEHDERTLETSHAVYRDEKKRIQSAREAIRELETLFEADNPENRHAAE
ncbi:MAG: cation:proton antiporter [Acetobacteraceae bacterium]|nr:cation:proton antiporter [Acetobacteraceae bacterium]